jgi:hypothetical protein
MLNKIVERKAPRWALCRTVFIKFQEQSIDCFVPKTIVFEHLKNLTGRKSHPLIAFSIEQQMAISKKDFLHSQ